MPLAPCRRLPWSSSESYQPEANRTAWAIAFRAFWAQKGSKGIIEAVRKSKDPTIFTVLFEDSAAALGLIIAFIGIALSQALDMPVIDAYASIGIGVVLAITATLLAIESKALLIGEAADPETLQAIRDIVAETTGIRRTNEILTMHLGPNEILLNLSLHFSNKMSATEVQDTISSLEAQIKVRFPDIKRIFIEAQTWRGHSLDATPPPPE